jgi:hypothetical protein
MELPSLGSEHALPLQRNTVPHLPIPTEVPRARMVDLPSCTTDGERERAEEQGEIEVVDAELVWEEEAAPR